VKDSELKIKKTFTLIEVLVVLAVFSFVMMGATRALISVQNAWSRQKQRIGLIQDSRWISEKLGLELRFGSDDGNKGKIKLTAHPKRLAFGFDSNRDDQLDTTGSTEDKQCWYWLSKTHGAHDQEPGFLYKGGEKNFGLSFNPNSDSFETAAFGLCTEDEDGNDYEFFDDTDEDDGVVLINFVLRPHPLEEDAPGNRSFHFITKIRARNTNND